MVEEKEKGKPFTACRGGGGVEGRGNKMREVDP